MGFLSSLHHQLRRIEHSSPSRVVICSSWNYWNSFDYGKRIMKRSITTRSKKPSSSSSSTSSSTSSTSLSSIPIQKTKHSSEFNISSKSQFIVSIVGPPNSGKSTLFNRLLDKTANRAYLLGSDKQKRRQRKSLSGGRLGSKAAPATQRGGAIISNIPGTTRDRRECWGRLGDFQFRLMDTAGIDGIRLKHSIGENTKSNRIVSTMTTTLQFDGTNENDASTQILETNPYNTTFKSHQLSLNYKQDDNPWVMSQMMQQTLEAAQNSHAILLVMDAKVGITSDWMEISKWLRRNHHRHISSNHHNDDDENSKQGKQQQQHVSNKHKVIVIANKLEGDAWNYDDSPVWEHLWELENAGFGKPIVISALHGEGMADLAIALMELQTKWKEQYSNSDNDEQKEEEEDNDDDDSNNDEDRNDGEEEVEESKTITEKPLQLAILGRQNVGKSTLVNALLQQNRVICGPMPGLTRDSIAIEWTYQNRPVKIVDTAGIRKITKRVDTMEDLAVQDAMRAMKVADVAVLVLDAQARKLERQELAIADAVVKEGRALVVVANKQDLLVTKDTTSKSRYSAQDFQRDVQTQLEERLPLLRKTPVITMSSLYNTNVDALLPIVFQARDRWERIISTGILNRWLRDVMVLHPPPMQRGRVTKIKYVLQTKGRPPTFLLFTNNHTELPQSYLRFLIRNFQDTFEYFGMEIRMSIKQSSPRNPYVSSSSSSSVKSSSKGKRLFKGKEYPKKKTIQAK